MSIGGTRQSLFPNGGRVRRQRGAALVQFAITLSLMLMLGSGVFDFGMMVRENTLVVSSARVGARTAAGLSSNSDVGEQITYSMEMFCLVAKKATEKFLKDSNVNPDEFKIEVSADEVNIPTEGIARPAVRVTVTRAPRWKFLPAQAFGAHASSVFIMEFPPIYLGQCEI